MNVHENGKVNKQNNRNEKSFTESKYFYFRLNVKFLLLVVVEWNWKTPRIDEIIPPYSTSPKDDHNNYLPHHQLVVVLD